MEKRLREILIESQKSHKLIAIYTNKDNYDSFCVGLVSEFNKDNLILHSFDPNGFDDGFAIFHIDDIHLVEVDSQYLNKLWTVINGRNNIDLTNNHYYTSEDNKANLLFNFYDYCIEKKYLVKIKLYNDQGIIGLINKYDHESITVNAISDNGDYDGIILFKSEDVERVYRNDQELSMISILINCKNNVSTNS